MRATVWRTVATLAVAGWMAVLQANAQTMPARPAFEERSDRDIVVLQYQDIADAFDASNFLTDGPTRRVQLRAYTLERYAVRKAEFRAFAAARGIEVLDTFPEFAMLSVPRGTMAVSLAGAPWLDYIAPDWGMQLHLSESSNLVNKHLLRETFPDADGQNKLTGGGTAVMILDTGVDYLLKELGGCVGGSCKVAVAKDFTPVDDNERDPNRHGTNVAAIAAGRSGIASDARIIAGDVMDIAGKISTAYVINAIGWAIANRDVYNVVAINMSFGGGPYHTETCSKSAYGAPVAEARRHGIVVVASSGNDFNPEGMPEPACAPYVVSVGAVFDGGPVDAGMCNGQHRGDTVTCFSNASPMTRLLAPGSQITAGGESMNGTSQAAPHVTGAVALLRGMEPGLSVTQVENRLRDTGIPILDQRNGLSLARLDLVALLQDSLQRPLPLPRAVEWWRTAQVDGRQLPVLTDAWFGRLAAPQAGTLDQATALLWSQPEPSRITLPAPLRTAQNYCRRQRQRLPTRGEMDSIQNLRRADPTIDTAVLTQAVSGPYWTMTPARRQGATNWVVNLSDGRAHEANAAQSLAHFFCVQDWRGDPPAVHYVDHGETVRDNATGLVWQKGTVTADDHHALADACVKSSVGAKRWRVPTWKELSSLLSAEHEAPYLDPMFAGETALTSSTPAPQRGMEFRYVDFQTGTSGVAMLPATRCVEQALQQAIAPSRVIKGDVWITGPDHMLGSRALQQLEAGMVAVIEGNLTITGIENASVILPYLKRVTGSVALGRTSTRWLSLPALEHVGGSLEVADNAKLDSLWLPSLSTVGEALTVQRNPQLGASQPPGDAERVVSVDLPKLDTVGGDFTLASNTQLKSLTLPKLRTVGRGVQVADHPVLWRMVLDSLASVGPACLNHKSFCGDLSIESNRQLTTASLRTLTSIAYDLRIRGNPLLQSFEQRVDRVITLETEFNTSLCERTTLDPMLSRMWRLGRFPAKVSIYHNSTEASCRTRCPNEAPGVCQILADEP